MTIALTGGGSGGHITPLLAVASELKKLDPALRIVYVGQRGDRLADIPRQHPAIDEVRFVWAGKFRRYHGEGLRQVLDIPTQVKNVRDAGLVLLGLWESFWLLRTIKPAIVFSRGGFVSVPVALGAMLNRIPYVTHDSDSLPSLANRVIAPWAALHAVALPEEFYPYPRAKTIMVGVPVGEEYVAVDSRLRSLYRRELGLGNFRRILLVTGGGNGADQLNRSVAKMVPNLLEEFTDLAIVHIAGRTLEDTLRASYDESLDASRRPRVIVKGFVEDFYRYSGAADVVIGRGGATNLAEFATQRKACIIVPAEQLVGGHQVKNALAMQERHAIVMLQNPTPADLASAAAKLLDSKEDRLQLESALGSFAQVNVAHHLAMILLDTVRTGAAAEHR